MLCSIVLGQHVVWLWFPTSAGFFLKNVSFTSQDLQTLWRLVFGAQKTQGRIKSMNYAGRGSCLVCCASQFAVGPNYFNNKKIRELDYFQVQGTYIPAEAQWFPQNPVIQQDGALLHITCAVCFLWMECFRIDGLEDMVLLACQQDHLTQLH